MNIIKKFKIGGSIQVLRPINQYEKSALFWSFVKNQGTPSQRKVACSLAEYMKDWDGWIQCDCDVQSPSFMTVGISINNNYYLQRINCRGQHHKKCQFKGIDRIMDYSLGANTSTPCQKNTPLRLHRRGRLKDEIDDDSIDSESNSDSSNSFPKLARVLYTFIEEARLNYLTVLKRSTVQEQFKSIKAIAKNYKLEKGIRAFHYLWSYPDIPKITKHLMETAHYWPEKTRPYALCITVVDEIHENKLKCIFKNTIIEVEVSGKIKSSSGRLGANSGPYLVIFTITDTEDNIGIYKPMNAFYVPVYSKYQLIPVDSRYERLVLNMIEQRAKWWIRDNHLKVDIIKPLFALNEFHEEELKTIKPDFLIRTPYKNVIFEVIGSHDSEYIERKNGALELMKKIGDVIEFDALKAEQLNQWHEQLKKKISLLSALMFKGNNLRVF